MSLLGSETVRRSFDADVVILKSQTPHRDCVHDGITLLRARMRIAALLIEKACNSARIASMAGSRSSVPQPSQ
jgi:hypothetical protein